MGHKLRVVGKFLLALSIFVGLTALMALSDSEIGVSFAILFGILSAAIFGIGVIALLFRLLDWVFK